LSLPQYDGEEEIHTQITYYKKHGFPIIIQTYIPDHPLLQNLLFSNTRNFMESLQKERKSFLYPPFVEIATLRVHHPSKEKVTRLISHLLHKINLIKSTTTHVLSDTTLFEKHQGEWVQKILLKDTERLSPLLDALEVEIVRNRSVTLEWNSL
jgi:primosomal protein N'